MVANNANSNEMQHYGAMVFHQGLHCLQCSPMAVGPSNISGNDWCSPVNSFPAADRVR